MGVCMDEPKFDDMTRRVMSYSKLMDCAEVGEDFEILAHLGQSIQRLGLSLTSTPRDLR
jgi:hypothetical protein